MSSETIHVQRMRGGLGDFVRLCAVLDGLQAQALDRRIILHCADAYAEFAQYARAGWFDTLRICARPYAGPEPFIELGDPCPARLHERQTHGRPTRERTHIFCEAAGVPFRPPSLIPNPLVFAAVNRPDAMIGLHRKPAGHIRAWSDGHWRALADLLVGAGYLPIWFGAHGEDLEGAPGVKVFGATAEALVASVARMQLVIAVDSGIFHVAGALGVPVLGLFGATDGALVSSVYPRARVIQAPKYHGCDGPCYGYNERGFDGGPCLEGCANLARVNAEEVFHTAMEMLRHETRPAERR